MEGEVVWLARQSRKKVKDSILAALVAKGMDSPYFLDLVEDYMDLWDIKTKLRKDLQERGPVVEWQNGANQKGLRKNDSVVEYPKISKRMTDILRQLEIDCRIEIDVPPQKEGEVDDQDGDEDIGL
ncbi:P27 family phage terminase small subunit [Enterococcus asini]|uniref:P27 family phage terminase small subunit n=1 Tax=Enterococcus asini TaxID=57732 RepID=UPI0028931EC1|nr:P27 family phage terminase small subunit [Enterococcus asini]